MWPALCRTHARSPHPDQQVPALIDPAGPAHARCLVRRSHAGIQKCGTRKQPYDRTALRVTSHKKSTKTLSGEPVIHPEPGNEKPRLNRSINRTRKGRGKPSRSARVDSQREPGPAVKKVQTILGKGERVIHKERSRRREAAQQPHRLIHQLLIPGADFDLTPLPANPLGIKRTERFDRVNVCNSRTNTGYLPFTIQIMKLER